MGHAYRIPSSDGIHRRLRRGRVSVCGPSLKLTAGGPSMDADTSGGALRLSCHQGTVLGSRERIAYLDIVLNGAVSLC